MTDLRETILACLHRHADDQPQLIARLDELAREHGPAIYSLILNLLADLHLAPEDALRHWRGVLRHQRQMSERLGRPVLLQTALLDYLSSRLPLPAVMKMVDINAFERLKDLSRTDPLTGLHNRRVFDELFAREASLASRHATDLSLIFFDLDDFKKINDRYGHQTGDEVLRQTTHILQTQRRSEDIVVRYGGEEFLLLLPHTGKHEALLIGERIRRAVAANQIRVNGHCLRVTLSGGLAAYPFDGAGPERLIEDADQALYHAKQTGKNRICLYSDSMRRYARAPLDAEVEIHDLRQRTRRQPARCRNISGGGLLLDSHRPFALGSLIETRLPILSNPPLALAGQVIHRQHQGPGRWRLGVRLLEPDRRTALAIASFILHRSLAC